MQSKSQKAEISDASGAPGVSDASVEALKAEVKHVITALGLIAAHPSVSFGDAYKQIGINYSLIACEIAAKIVGCDPFFAKMLNHKFRTDAAELMFERSLAEVGRAA